MSAACRAGFWPRPAWITQPMITSSTSSGFTPARLTASRTTIAPSCGAENPFNEPRNFPTGVRAALRGGEHRRLAAEMRRRVLKRWRQGRLRARVAAASKESEGKRREAAHEAVVGLVRRMTRPDDGEAAE